MSKFYSSIQGDRGEATRCGHRGIRASAQSFEGSIITYLFPVRTSDDDERIFCRILAAKGSAKFGGSDLVCLYEGPIDALLDGCGRAAIVRAFAEEQLKEEFDDVRGREDPAPFVSSVGHR